MEQAVWDEKFNIGVEVIDKAHAKLFRIVKKLLDISEDAKANQHAYKEGIKYLETYTMKHFSEEEAYMRSIRYAAYGQHKRIHDNFRDKTLISLKRDMELSGYSLLSVQRFIKIMSNWLAEHIMGEDQAIVGRSVPRRGYDISSQIPVIARTVCRTTLDLFQVETTLISAEYKGQNIGNGFYCRQLYDLEGGIRLQLLLGLEAPLILRGLNRSAEMQAIPEGPAANEACLSVFGQLFQDMGKLFRVEEEYELKKENLMSRNEFRTDFMKGYPCSLLFSSRLGYLIFCYRSWRIPSQAATAAAEKEKAAGRTAGRRGGPQSAVS